MVEKVKVEGLKELEKALLQLPRATARNVGFRTLLKAGKPMADLWQRLAPKFKGHLKRSGGIGTRLTSRQAKQHPKRDPVEVYIGPNNPAGVFQEFGTQDHVAQPFMRPAWDQEKKPTLDRIVSILKSEIAKSAARAARKAARIAAQNALQAKK